MVLPVVAYGHPVLRKVAVEIDPSDVSIQKLIDDLWETMYATNGVGIAAPQVNKSLRLFVVDTIQVVENFDEEDKRLYPDEKPIKAVFINAKVEETSGESWVYNEGCLSIPRVREDVKREQEVVLSYLDENGKSHEKTFTGITARVILHEYDHIEGKLFIDYLAPLKKRLLKKKLGEITSGKIRTDYRMIFAQQ